MNNNRNLALSKIKLVNKLLQDVDKLGFNWAYNCVGIILKEEIEKSKQDKYPPLPEIMKNPKRK